MLNTKSILYKSTTSAFSIEENIDLISSIRHKSSLTCLL